MKTEERLELLFDAGSVEVFPFTTSSGYVTAVGKVNGQKVYCSAINPDEKPNSVFDGLQHHLNFLKNILKDPAPLVMIMDTPAYHSSASKSPFPPDSDKLLADENGIGKWYRLHSELSGKVPQVAVVCAKMGASLTFPPMLCDMTVMLKSAGMSLGRPDVVEKILGEKVDYSQLGGPEMHATISGSIDRVAETEKDAFEFTRKYLSFFVKSTNKQDLRNSQQLESEFSGLIPDNPNSAFDMQKVIANLADHGDFFELRANFAKELVTGFARIDGQICAIIANNSISNGGIYFPASCRKATRFISICNAFGIPAIFLADSAGFMVGSAVEQAGIIKEAAFMMQTIANAKIAKLSVVVRRDYTAGVYAMSGGGMGNDGFIALPTASISIYGKVVANKIAATGESEEERNNRNKMLEAAQNPAEYLKNGLLDEIVAPNSLKLRISQFLSDHKNTNRATHSPVLLV